MSGSPDPSQCLFVYVVLARVIVSAMPVPEWWALRRYALVRYVLLRCEASGVDPAPVPCLSLSSADKVRSTKRTANSRRWPLVLRLRTPACCSGRATTCRAAVSPRL